MYLSQANSLSLVEAALFYADLGYRVFPVRANGKAPVPGMPWKQAATDNPDTIEQWWSIYPGSNIGMVMGVDADVNCLDIDHKLGKNGYESYNSILDDDYRGPVQKTPTGGEHRFFEYEPGFSNWANKGTSGGLDMRTDAGYIVVAPSIRPEGQYQWAVDADVPEAEPLLRVAFQTWSNEKDLVTSDAPDTPEDLIDYRTLGLKDRYMDYLETGDMSGWESSTGFDESAVIFSVAGAVMRAVQDEAQAFGILICNPHVMACAERHSTHGNPTDWLWQYGIGPMIKIARRIDATEVFTPLGAPKVIATEPEETQPWDLPKPESKPLYVPHADTFFITPSIGFQHFLRPAAWIVKGLIEESQIGALYGPSGSFKTFMALDICLHVSLGLDWHGRKTYKQQYCCFITSEGLDAIWKRVEAWRLAYNFRHMADDDYEEVTQDEIQDSGFVISKSGVDLLDIETLVPLNAHIHAIGHAPAIVVFDTLASNMYGNENSTEDMSRLVNHCKSARAAYGCNVMVVHHTGHSDSGRMRGASALYAGLDYVLHVNLQKGAAYTIDMKSTKAKDSEKMIPMSFDLVPQAIGMKEMDGTDTTSLAPRLAVKQCRNVSMTAQRKLSLKQVEVLNVALDVIAKRYSEAKLNNYDFDGWVGPDEVCKVYNPLHKEIFGKKTNNTDTKNSLSALFTYGYLNQDTDDSNVVWYGKPVKDVDADED